MKKLKRSNSSKGITMGIIVSQEIREQIELISKQEKRSFSSTMRILLEEAIHNRTASKRPSAYL